MLPCNVARNSWAESAQAKRTRVAVMRRSMRHPPRLGALYHYSIVPWVTFLLCTLHAQFDKLMLVMKRAIIERTGAPAEVVRIDEVHTPGEPGGHDALLELVASPIHPADLLTIMGRYATSSGPMPKVLGKEGLGRVLSVGPMVKHLKPGDLTPLLLQNDGVWQEQHILDAAGLVALPPGGDKLQYAMAIGNPATARLMLRDIVPLELGDWVVQNAANSAVGQYLIQLAKREG